MSQSPADIFFARQAELANSLPNPMSRINEAVASHQARLAERTATKQAELDAYSKTAAGRLGFDSDSTAGQVFNAIEGVKNAAIKGIGQGIAAIPGSIGLAEQSGISPEIHDMYDRFQPHREDYDRVQALRKQRDGQSERALIGSEALELANLEASMKSWGINQEEIDQLTGPRTRTQVNQPAQITEGPVPAQTLEGPTEQTNEMDRSYLESIDLGNTLLGAAETIRDITNNDELIDQRNTQAFAQDVISGSEEGLALLQSAFNNTKDESLKERWLDGALGFSALVGNAFDAITDNPAGFAEVVTNELAESLGGMAVAGTAGITATNVGYSVEAYQKGIENYKAAHEGAMPDEDTREEMAQSAFLAFVLNSGADAAALKVLGSAGRSIPRTEGVAGAATQMATAPGKLAGSAAVQGATEIGATYYEGEAAYDSASAQDLYYAAVVGAGMGGTVGAPGAVREEAAATADMVREVAAKVGIGQSKATEQAEVKTFTEAMATNDPTPYTDPTSEAYSPSRAMGVLFGNANLDTTPDEQKRANRDQASDIIKQATQVRDNTLVDWNAANPEQRKQQEALVTELETKIAEAAPEEAEQLRGDVDLLKSMLAESEQLSGKEIRARKRAYEKAQEELDTALKLKENLDKDIPYTPEEVESILTAVREPVDEATGQQGAERVINLAMEQPELFTTEQIDAVVNDAKASLSPVQRDYLRALSASKVAENSLKTRDDVSSDVLVGGKGYKGLTEYRSNISKAVRFGSLDTAQKEVSQLQKFGESRLEKVTLAEQANIQAKETGKPVQLVRTKDDQWQLTSGVENVRESGGLTFEGDAKGDRLIESIRQDSTAIQAALTEASALMAINSPSPMTAPTAPANEEPVSSAETDTLQTEDIVIEGTPIDTTDALASTVTPVDEATDGSVNVSSLAEEAMNAEASPIPTTQDIDLSSPTETAPVEPVPVPTSDTRTTVEPVTEPAETGQLSVFKSSNNAVLQQSNNPVPQYFKQEVPKAEGAAQRPLVAQKNFISEVIRNPKKVREFVKGDITPQQSTALKGLLSSAKRWAPVIQASLPKKGNEAFIYKDPVQGFANDDGTYDENFTSAISAATYTWVAETGTGVQFNNEEAINSILGRPRSTPVSPNELEAFATVGTRRNQLINSLGKRAVQALGIKASNTAPADQISRLESGLGAHVYNVLKQEGIITEHVMSAQEMGAFRESNDTKAVHIFARMAGSTGREPVSPITEAIIENTRQSENVVNRLFGIESEGLAPSFEPESFKQEKAQKSRMNVPNVQKEALDKHGKKAYRVRTGDMGKLMDALPRAALAAMAGFVDTGTTFVHPMNATSVEAKNKGIERELDAYFDFLATTEGKPESRNQPFYLKHAVWLQQRVGMASRSINLQASKIHRHLVQMDGWEQKDVAIDPTDERFIQFRLGVADALGIKTDALSREAALAKLDAELSNVTVQQGITSLRKVLNDLPLEDRDIELLVDAVNEGGEKYHTLDGLMAHAQYIEALESGASTFTHNLTREIDGKTNGPMLTQILTGAANSVAELQSMVEKGGFFSREDGPTQVNQWASEKGNTDLYQSVAKVVADTARGQYQENREKYNALFKITDPLTEQGEVTKAGRNATKTPVTQVNFGSSVKNTIASMGAEFADGLLKKVEKIINTHREKGTDPSHELAALSDAVATLTGTRISGKQLTQKLPASVGKRLQDSYVDLLGPAIEAGINHHYETFLTTRNQINTAGRLGFGLYNALRKVRHAQLVLTQVPKDGKGKPKHDLTGEQSKRLDDSLKNVEPMVHTALSKLSGDIRSGFSLIEMDQGLSEADFYRSEVHFGEGGFANSDGKRTATTKVSGNAVSQTDRGVGTLVLLVHGVDSAISLLSYQDHPALNVHDANIVAADMTQAQARRLNENTFKVLLDYSIPTEMAESLERTLNGFLVEAQKDPNNKDLRREYKALLKEASKGLNKGDVAYAQALGLDAVGYQLLKMKQTAQQADITKLEAMRQWISVDQYSMDGGNYLLAEADYAAIDDALAARKLDAPTDQLDAAKALATLMKQPVTITAPVSQTLDTQSWGTQGTPKQAAHAGLTDFLARRKTTTAKEVMAFLATALEGDTTGFQKTLLAQLRQQVGNVAVSFVTPDMPVPEGTKERAAGWFYQDKDGKQTIFVRSPDFAASRIDPELMLHELVHAATANTLSQARNGKSTPEVTQIMTDLEDLRTAVVEHLAKDDLRSQQYKPAIESIEELVAWGMTNEGFQAVLKEVQVAPRTAPNSLVDGMKAFIKSLVGLVFPKGTRQQEVMESGLTRLISNSAGLMAAGTDTAAEINLAQENVDPVDEVMSWTTDQVFEALEATTDNVSEAHRNHLRDVLGSMVNELHGPFGAFKTQALKSQALTPDQVYLKALQENRSPFASNTLAAGFALSAQESFVLEQVEASVAASLDSSKTAYKELAKVYQQARVALKGNPTLTADQYAFLFTMENADDGRSAHLSRFAALALAHEPLNNAMQGITPKEAETAENASLATRIQDWFNRLLAFINEKITGTYNGQPANQKIQTLAESLVHIEAKRRVRLANQRSNPFEFIEVGSRKGADKGRDGLAKVGDSRFFRESKNGYVKAAGKTLSTVAKDRVGEVIEQAQILRDRHFKKRQGMVAAIISEMTGADDKTKTLYMLNRMTKNIERTRIEAATQAGAQVIGSYAHKGAKLTKQEKEGLTAALLRTDLSALLETYSTDDIHDLLIDKTRLTQERAKLENAVAALPMGKLYTQQADDLGKFMATGENYNPMLQLNAHNIAHLYGFAEAKQVEVSKEVVSLIDQLATLNALSYTDTSDIQAVVAKEKVRGNESGIEFTLRMAQYQKEQSLEKLFQGSPVLMAKGYTKEITDPYKTAVAAPSSSYEAMKQRGYSASPEMMQDPADSSDPMRLYVIDDGGLKRYLSGSMSLTGERAKGTTLHGGLVPEGTNTLSQSRVAMTAAMTRKKQALLKSGNRQKGHMVPVFNDAGEVVNYRYMMTYETRDNILGRNNALDAVMGGLEGELLDKVASPEHNRKVVEALRDLYKADFAVRPDSYLSIS
ncbi:hypothetical protein, partial [Vreelandella venusta]